ncbi:MAG: cytochrome P450 [Pseudomonadota bacterium]
MSSGTARREGEPALPNPSARELSHIPGENGIIGFGHTLDHLKDTGAFARNMTERYGPVFRQRCWGTTQIGLMGPEANELVLKNRSNVFSSRLGWKPNFERLFPRGLMMMDFEEHRFHRKLISVAFKPAVMATYVDRLNALVADTVAQWTSQPSVDLYPALKDLTLRLAAAPFLGVELGPKATELNLAFTELMKASVSPLRKPFPFSQMKRGTDGRNVLVQYLQSEITGRRGSKRTDMFSVLANATDENGNSFTDVDVVEHMIFIMMAAHDTLASSGTAFIAEIAQDSAWQDRLRQQILSTLFDPSAIQYEELGALTDIEMAFNETLRLHPPLSNTPRRALESFQFGGYEIPKGSYVWISANYTHTMPSIWPEPTRFDPARFEANCVKQRHRYAWIPFGGGAHKCIGLHFAYMQIKILASQILANASVSLAQNNAPEWQPWPLFKPKGTLLAAFERGRQSRHLTKFPMAAE